MGFTMMQVVNDEPHMSNPNAKYCSSSLAHPSQPLLLSRQFYFICAPCFCYAFSCYLGVRGNLLELPTWYRSQSCDLSRPEACLVPASMLLAPASSSRWHHLLAFSFFFFLLCSGNIIFALSRVSWSFASIRYQAWLLWHKVDATQILKHQSLCLDASTIHRLCSVCP